jgi:hypothetical protein
MLWIGSESGSGRIGIILADPDLCPFQQNVKIKNIPFSENFNMLSKIVKL